MHGHSCGSHHHGCGCGPRDFRERFERFAHHHFGAGDDLGGSFGVRRPLRFLAWKLELSDTQVPEFAAILNELKTERAQAAVDDRRALALLADAAGGAAFDTAKAGEAAKLRLESQTRLQQKVTESLGRMVAALEPEQRQRLAYLLRTGTLVM